MVISKTRRAPFAKGSESLKLESPKDLLRDRTLPVSFPSFPPSSPCRPVLNIYLRGQDIVWQGTETQPPKVERKFRSWGWAGVIWGVSHGQ